MVVLVHCEFRFRAETGSLRFNCPSPLYIYFFIKFSIPFSIFSMDFWMGNIDKHGKLIRDQNFDEDIAQALKSTVVQSLLTELDGAKEVGSLLSTESNPEQSSVDIDRKFNVLHCSGL